MLTLFDRVVLTKVELKEFVRVETGRNVLSFDSLGEQNQIDTRDPCCSFLPKPSPGINVTRS